MHHKTISLLLKCLLKLTFWFRRWTFFRWVLQPQVWLLAFQKLSICLQNVTNSWNTRALIQIHYGWRRAMNTGVLEFVTSKGSIYRTKIHLCKNMCLIHFLLIIGRWCDGYAGNFAVIPQKVKGIFFKVVWTESQCSEQFLKYFRRRKGYDIPLSELKHQ